MKKNYWKNKNVFITGINGFVGGNLAKRLINSGANVFGLIRNFDEKTFIYLEKIHRFCTLIEGNLTNKDLLERVIVENRIEIIFHLAAQVEVGIGFKNPFDTFETNIRGTYCLLDAVNKNKKNIESIIVASSDKAYGDYPKTQLPYKENYALKPKFPYDTSKACADMIANSYSNYPFFLPIVITRFANIYGPGQMNFSALIPDSIKCALNYSKFIPRSDGTYIRDYLFIDDVIQLYLLIAENIFYNKKKLSGQIFNAGSGNFYSVKEILKIIFILLKNNSKFKIIELEMKNKKTKGEIFIQSMDYMKVNKYFNWKPTIKLKDGLKKTIKWYKKYLKEFLT